MSFQYVAARLMRKASPAWLIRSLMRRRLLLKPGAETRDPGVAVQGYLDALAEANRSISGQDVLIFGYGGRFAVGESLATAGAKRVTLFDPFARPEGASPSDRRVVLTDELPLRNFDLVFSWSVLEHVRDLQETVIRLAGLTAASGLQVHFVDLRDHYFKQPFAMLCYSERAWRRLNPPSNLNRARLPDYRRAFGACFGEVTVTVLNRDPAALAGMRHRIRQEFLHGEEDDVTLIRLVARP